MDPSATLYFPEMPKIEYTLSFENYQEMMGSRGKKKTQRIPLAVALLGLLCILWGYSILKSNSNPDVPVLFFPGGFLLLGGLVLTGASMLLGLRVGNRPPVPDASAQRLEYALFHADKRIFDYDENGFRVRWYEGEDVRPWSNLRQIRDLKTLFVLGTATTFYWLPRDVLMREGKLEPLRARAESALLDGRGLLFEVPIRPSPFVYAAAGVTHFWHTRPLNRILTYTALTLAALWAVSSRAEFMPRPDYWLVALVPPLILVGEYFYCLKYYSRIDWSKHSTSAEILTDRIAYRSKSIRWVAFYRELTRVTEIPGAFLLYFRGARYHLIAKRGFSSDQLAQFRSLIHKKP
jgi:hypothetical protein